MNALSLFAAVFVSLFTPANILHAQGAASATKREAGKSAVQAKAEKLMLERISFAEAPIEAALQDITTKALQADEGAMDGLEGKTPDWVPVNVMLRAGGEAAQKGVTMELKNVSVWDALTAVAKSNGLEMTVVSGTILLHTAAMKPRDCKGPGLTDSDAWKAIGGVKLPRLSLVEAGVGEAFAYYTQKARDGGKDVNLLSSAPMDETISLDLRRPLLTEVLELTAELTGQEIVPFGRILVMRAAKDGKGRPDKNVKPDAAPEWMNTAAWKKAEEITIDRVSFFEAEAADAAVHLTKKAKEGDKAGKGVAISLNGFGARGVTFDLRGVRVSDLLRALAEVHGLEISVDEKGISLGKAK